jgi:hypothetical protein
MPLGERRCLEASGVILTVYLFWSSLRDASWTIGVRDEVLQIYKGGCCLVFETFILRHQLRLLPPRPYHRVITHHGYLENYCRSIRDS